MREVGEVNPLHPLGMAAVGLRTISNPWVDLAMTFLLMYSLLSLSALSWLDLSYMLPITAFNYVLTSLLAWRLLHEEIAATRWVGTFTIALGVLFVSLSDCRKRQQQGLRLSIGQKPAVHSYQEENHRYRR
jgi:drug/metabolite transporter (DMT)-like permease